MANKMCNNGLVHKKLAFSEVHYIKFGFDDI